MGIFRKRFKENFNRLIEQKGCTQKEIAEYVKIRQNAVSDWYVGKKVPRFDKLEKLCEFFEVDISELFKG